MIRYFSFISISSHAFHEKFRVINTYVTIFRTIIRNIETIRYIHRFFAINHLTNVFRVQLNVISIHLNFAG